MKNSREKQPLIRRTCDLAPFGLVCIPYVGVNRAVARFRPVPHRHSGCLEILLNANAVCEYDVGGTRYALKPDCILVVPPDTDHSIIEHPKGLRTYSLHLRMDGRTIPGLSKSESSWLRQQLGDLPTCFSAVGCGIKNRFERVLNLAETSTPTVRNHIVLRMAVTDLLLAIVAAATQPHQPPVNRRLQALARQMKDHPESAYPLPQLARTSGLSVNALISQFRALTGDTPHAHLLRCRIERAKRLLPDHTCASVAHRLGFPSPQHFATQFKRLTGLTPREQAATDRRLKDALQIPGLQ